MIRKTLTILSFLGLLLSAGVWGMSYWDVGVTLASGLAIGASDGLLHIGREPPLGGGYGWSTTMTIWPTSVLFALMITLIIGRPLHQSRCRKRKKLGLCLQCGYDLRASKERCPECGKPFNSPTAKAER